ncbi:RNA polymerase sigma-70 factor [Bacteroides thetaiotaomicron]|uniref:RNA polymerase sigma-70 factor n=1 Tax=Bacteroides thetaiotaomicron TaxID=818 RepID=UPI001E4411B5|nr:RNA polymerase sigma-70 factor [Bacteroides thetaiotaomicron]MDC2172692.1 RNA polymerase sigma-70 factor [Bacteroides thetaiotaomicron]MDC2187920.1 RNA polymerase sigma-70 factor [Bacteroides thetaiotaomicron]
MEIPLIRNHIESAEVRGLIGKKEFKQFFKKYYSVFLSFACRYHVDAEEARDIVQDVFIVFWEQRDNFSSIINIKAFFYRSISNRCLNYLKHEEIKNRYAESQLQEMETEEFILENIIREEVSFIVRQKIEKLTSREQEIIILSLQNKSNQEIAELLSLSITTVKTHKARAYIRLRKELKELRYLLLVL